MSTQSFKVKSGLTLTPTDLTTLTNPQAGDLACDINDSNKIKRYDANSAAWTEVGSGGVGGTDILFVQDFESASLSSFTQTGLSLSQTDPLHGKVSALLTHQNAVNQSFKQVIAVDRKFRGEAMTMRLNVKSNASAGNVTINIYDETNAANLVASEQLQLANDTSGALNKIAFTIPETCASLSYTITALPEAGSPVTRVDDIIAELAVTSLLETSVEVPVITAWQGYTPTFQGFGTPTAIEFEWRQVGEDVEIRGKFTGGTVTAVEARVGLPGGLTSSGTDKIPSIQSCGIGARGENGVAGTYQVLIEPNVSYVTFALGSSSTSGYAKVNGSNLVNAGASFGFFAKVPCAGLSATTTKTIDLTQSGLVQNPDSMVRVDTSNGYGSTANKILRFTNVTQSIGPDILYQDSATNGGSFTAITSGVYSFSFSCESTSANQYFGLSKNSNQLTTAINGINIADRLIMTREASTNHLDALSWTGYLQAGDVIRAHTEGNAIGNPSYVNFVATKQSSLKQVTVSSDQKIKIPTSELRMEGASSRGAVATAIVRFDTVAKLRGDAFTITSNANDGTFITMTKAGKLEINASFQMGASSGTLAISKNQTVLTALATGSEALSTVLGSANQFTSASASLMVSVGDIIRVGSTQGLTSDLRNNLTLTFQEQDISVSVTNTLPQFSESDLSVKGAGNAGQSITSNVTNVPFQTVEDTTGGNWNGSQFTVPETGLYSISASIYFTTSPNGVINLYKNGNFYKRISQIATSNIHVASGIVESFTQGEVISLRFEGTGTLLNGTTYHWISITKVGKPNVTGVDVTPFVQIPQNDVETTYYVNVGSFAGGATITGALTSSTNKGILSYNSSTGVYTALKRCTVNASVSARSSSATSAAVQIVKNASTVIARGNTLAAASYFASASGEFTLEAGETFFCNLPDGPVTGGTYVNVAATAASDSIITATESFSTDTASLQYVAGTTDVATTLANLANQPVGSFTTFTYAANTNTRSITSTAPTQSTSDMNVNGIQIFARAYNAASTAAQPAVVAIQIGKGLKGRSLDLYKSAGKVTAGSLDSSIYSTTVQYGAAIKDYNEITGVLLIDAGFNLDTSIVARNLTFSDATNATSGYLVINASKSPALVGVPQVQPRVATLSDVKASGTDGGTFTGGSYQTRTLNTIEDSTGIVTSLASNQFTLSTGQYYIEFSAPAYAGGDVVQSHKAKIRNITDSTDAIIGSAELNRRISSASVSSNRSVGNGYITITSAKTFELQHRCGATATGNGFGANANFGDNEVYSIVKIKKVK